MILNGGGAYAVELYDNTPTQATIAADGVATAASISAPGQTEDLTFPVVAGQMVSLEVVPGTVPSDCTVTVSIVGADGFPLSRVTALQRAESALRAGHLLGHGKRNRSRSPRWKRPGSATLRLFTVRDQLACSQTAIPVP